MRNSIHLSVCRFLALLLMLTLMLSLPAQASSVKAKVSTTDNFYQYPTSSSSHMSIEKGTVVTVTEVQNGWAKVKCSGVTGYVKTSILSAAKKTGTRSGNWKSKVVALKWFDGGSSALKKGQYGYIYDIKSGSKIKIYRMGGHSHADIEPATYSDGLKLKKLGSSWDPRPVILMANGKYIACSINTKCHGDQTITTNGYNGQICLHMVGSKTHGGDEVRVDHQKAIEKAYYWAH